MNFHKTFFEIQQKNEAKKNYVSFTPCPPSGIVLMMSESPGSIIDNVLTLKYLPQAVPKALLSPE